MRARGGKRTSPADGRASRSRFFATGLVLCLLAALALPAAETQEVAAAHLSGRVLVAVDGDVAPIPDIGVQLTHPSWSVPRQTTTDSRGRWSFGGLESGPYTLNISVAGFAPFSEEVSLQEGEERELDTELEPVFGQAVTVTATRTRRATEEVAAAISVIGSDAIQATPMTNIAQALAGTPGVLIESKNQGYDSRLIIRGSGLKARYAIREIMVLLNGIPITDPDSLTRLDFVDTLLIDRIEVVRGPNSTLWGINSTGGVVNVITKSPLDSKGGIVRFDAGEFGTRSYQANYTAHMDETLSATFNVSRRESDNDWRPWNAFDTTQFTIQPALRFESGVLWENFLSYTDANLQLPGRLVVSDGSEVDQWAPYLQTGNVQRTAEPFKHSGRYSEIFYYGTRVTKRIGPVDLKSMLYLNQWSHRHPVTGRINDAETWVGGLDLQADWQHTGGTLTGGVSLRWDDQDSEAFTYDDVQTLPDGRVLSTLSDEPGELMRVMRRLTHLTGLYGQDSFDLGERWIVEAGARVDRISFDLSGYEWLDYDYGAGTWVEGDGLIDSRLSYTVFSPRVGAVYLARKGLNLYGNISTGTQTPTTDELTINPLLDLTRVLNYEAGVKARHRRFNLDGAVYFSPVEDEVVQVIQEFGETEYVNAGRTEKTGIELATTLNLAEGLSVGLAYSWSHFVFEEFSEPVRGENVDRSGNRLPYVPTHQYSLSASYRHPAGFKIRLRSNSWGSYWMDNANTEKYEGYRLVTDLTVGYERSGFEIGLMAQNLFDERYAVEAQKDLYGGKRYMPTAPRSLSFRLSYKF